MLSVAYIYIDLLLVHCVLAPQALLVVLSFPSPLQDLSFQLSQELLSDQGDLDSRKILLGLAVPGVHA